MKHLKKFENTNKPKIGDFVLIHTNFIRKEVNDFFTISPCKIISISNRTQQLKDGVKLVCDPSKLTNDVQRYFKYSDIYGYTIDLNLENIEYFSENIEDVYTYIESKKYNL